MRGLPACISLLHRLVLSFNPLIHPHIPASSPQLLKNSLGEVEHTLSCSIASCACSTANFWFQLNILGALLFAPLHSRCWPRESFWVRWAGTECCSTMAFDAWLRSPTRLSTRRYVSACWLDVLHRRKVNWPCSADFRCRSSRTTGRTATSSTTRKCRRTSP